MKKLLIALLVQLLVLPGLTVRVSASNFDTETEDVTILDSGSLGSNCQYVLESNGLLTITGKGTIQCNAGNDPWNYYRSKVTEAIIGEGITKVSNGLFQDHENLVKVTLPESLTELGSLVFNRCRSLKSIHFGNNLKTIGADCFDSCDALEYVTLPASLESIGWGINPFFQCMSLKEVRVEAGNRYYTSRDGVLFDKEMTMLYTFPAGKGMNRYVVPSTVKRITYGAFSQADSVIEVILPEGLEEIGAYSFMECGFYEVNIPANVNSIDLMAFCSCPFLERITVDPDNQHFTAVDGVLFSKDMSELIIYPRSKKDVIYYNMPDGVKTVNSQSFGYVHWPEGLIVADGVTTFERNAMDFMASLSEIYIPRSVTEIQSDAFTWCMDLSRVYYEGTEEEWNQISIESGNSYLTNVGRYYGSYPDLTLKMIVDEASGKPVLTWTKMKNVQKYQIYCSASETGNEELLYETTDTKFIHNDAEIGKTYYYRVKYVDNSGVESTYSNQVSDTCLPARPVIEASLTEDGYALITIDPVPGASEYEVAYVENRRLTASEDVVLATITSTSYVDETITEGVTRYYEVRAIGNDALAGHYSKQSCVTKTVQLSEPEITGVSMNTSGLTVKWNAVSGADEYSIFRKEASGEYKELMTLAETNFTDNTVVAGVQYTYMVQAHDSSAGVYSDYSAAKTVTYNPFKDVKSSSAHYKNIMWAFNSGLVNGMTKTTFQPEGTCMRKSFAIMLWKLMGRPEPSGTNPFKDISGCTKNEKAAIQWCYENGIVNGMSRSSFAPEGDVTRKAVVIMLWKAAGRPAPTITVKDSKFTDISNLTKNEQSAILWAFENGITKGTTKTTFGPEENCLREQLCTFLARYNKLLNLLP